MNMIDPILETDDKIFNGFIDNPEYILAKQAVTARLQYSQYQKSLWDFFWNLIDSKISINLISTLISKCFQESSFQEFSFYFDKKNPSLTRDNLKMPITLINSRQEINKEIDLPNCISTLYIKGKYLP